MKKLLVFVSFSLLLLSCSSGVKYLGNKYPETEMVKIYFSKADVPKAYEVIGKVYLDVEESTKDEKIQNMILNKAKANGGDAVIMGDLNVVRSGSVTGSTGGTARVGKRGTIGGGTKKSKTTNDLRMEVEVIRFKDHVN